MRRLAGVALVAAVGCVMPSPQQVTARNCATSIHNFEMSYCENIIPTADRHQGIAFEAQQISRSCQDPTSQTRLRELDTTCIAKFRVATSERDRDDEAIRRKFAAKVTVLQAEDEYLAAREAYRSARDEAGIAAREYEERGYPIRSPYERRLERTKQAADAALGRLHEVIARHGIEPKYGTVLGLW